MFQKDLLVWYESNHRQLPWRENHDPYRIWLSEIMLQQTQVVTVIDYFNRFVEAYPTVYDMARADEQDVLKLWEGLGYYSRARRLIPCAQMVVDRFDGQFPKDYHTMLKLPGIGSYTAGAILSIAYNIPVPAVDGNVMRVYSRLFNLDFDLSNSKTKGQFEAIVSETLPEDVRHFNQALMELGATICTPKKTKCSICPIAGHCQAKALDLVHLRPIKSKKIKKKHQKMVVCLLSKDDQIMIEKRPDTGLLAGLWAFPTYPIEGDLNTAIEMGLMENYDVSFSAIEILKEDKHVFTHLIWDMIFVKVLVDEKCQVDLPEMKWIAYEQLGDYPLPTAFKKLL